MRISQVMCDQLSRSCFTVCAVRFYYVFSDIYSESSVRGRFRALTPVKVNDGWSWLRLAQFVVTCQHNDVIRYTPRTVNSIVSNNLFSQFELNTAFQAMWLK